MVHGCNRYDFDGTSSGVATSDPDSIPGTRMEWKPECGSFFHPLCFLVPALCSAAMVMDKGSSMLWHVRASFEIGFGYNNLGCVQVVGRPRINLHIFGDLANLVHAKESGCGVWNMAKIIKAAPYSSVPVLSTHFFPPFFLFFLLPTRFSTKVLQAVKDVRRMFKKWFKFK